MNDVFGEAWVSRHANYYSDPDAGPDALLNDATEWLQYAHSAIHLVAELVDERGGLKGRHLPIVLGGIAAFIEMGASCAAQGHLRMQWEEVRGDTESVVAES